MPTKYIYSCFADSGFDVQQAKLLFSKNKYKSALLQAKFIKLKKFLFGSKICVRDLLFLQKILNLFSDILVNIMKDNVTSPTDGNPFVIIIRDIRSAVRKLIMAISKNGEGPSHLSDNEIKLNVSF